MWRRGGDYVDLAVQSARSLRASNCYVVVDLFCDQPGASGLDVFDRVHPVPRKHARAKLECLALSRFERTLFLDADTLVVADLGDLWAIADRFDLAMAHDVRRASALVQEGYKVKTPYAFPQLNSGVMLYRNTHQTRSFFGEWAARFHESGVARDQVILKDLLWQSDLRFYVLPPEFNLRRVTMLDAWEPLDARVKIIHSHRLLQHLRGGGQRISNVETLVRAERAALAAEWKAAGLADPQLDQKLDWFIDHWRGAGGPRKG